MNVVQLERRLRKVELQHLGGSKALAALSDEALIKVLHSMGPLTAADEALVASFRAACDASACIEGERP